VRPNAIVAVLAVAGIVVALTQTLAIPIVPDLPQLLHADAADTVWAVTATLLAAAVATPVVGRLDDMYGKRRMLLVSLGILLAGSLVCALSSSLVPFILGRALQGLAAGVIPLGISIMRDELPADKLGSSTALMSASLGIGGAIGLPVAAFVAENFDWHVLFWASAVLGAFAVALVLFLVPESSRRTGVHFDLGRCARSVRGAVGAAAGGVEGRLAGLGQRHHARPVRRGRRRLRRLALLRAARWAAAGRSALHRPPAGAVHQPGRAGVRRTPSRSSWPSAPAPR
jgi:MFS family permease